MPSSVAHLRRELRKFALGNGVSRARLDDVALAVTEIVTNAVLHAFPETPGEVRLSAEVVDGAITIRVLDDGIGLRPRPDSPGAGLGLIITSQLAEQVVFGEPADGGTEVALTFATAA